jgi:hypothetical protein
MTTARKRRMSRGNRQYRHLVERLEERVLFTPIPITTLALTYNHTVTAPTGYR